MRNSERLDECGGQERKAAPALRAGGWDYGDLEGEGISCDKDLEEVERSDYG